MFARVRLADEQIAHIHAQFFSVAHIERMLGVDKGALARDFLHLGYHLQGQRGFAAGLGAVDFDHTAAWQAAHAQSDVEAERARGDDLHIFDFLAFAQAHDGAFAKLLFNLRQRRCQSFGFFAVHLHFWGYGFGCAFGFDFGFHLLFLR